MLNPKFVVVDEGLGSRYADAKTNISWAQPALDGRVDLSELRRLMDALHRAWPGSIYADANFPTLLGQFEGEWARVVSQCPA